MPHYTVHAAAVRAGAPASGNAYSIGAEPAGLALTGRAVDLVYSGAGAGLPSGWADADYGAELIMSSELASDNEGDYNIFFASGGAGETATDYTELVTDPFFPRALRVHHLDAGNTSPTWNEGSFTGVTKLWFRHAFRFSTVWESGISYKFTHLYPGPSPTNRLRVDLEHGDIAFGGSFSGLGVWSNTRLVTTHMAQPANTTNLDTLNFEDTICPTYPDWWEMIVCAERMASPTVDGMTRMWVRRMTVSGSLSLGNWYFNGAYHTGTTTNFPLIDRIYLGVNRNEAAIADNEYIDRSRWFIVDGTQDSDPWGVDSMRP